MEKEAAADLKIEVGESQLQRQDGEEVEEEEEVVVDSSAPEDLTRRPGDLASPMETALAGAKVEVREVREVGEDEKMEAASASYEVEAAAE